MGIFHFILYKAKFEPHKKVLSGAGQSELAFKEYVSAMDTSTRPAIYMLYVSLKNANINKWYKKQKAILDEYPWMLMPQIGLRMTSDGKPEEHYEDKVAQGLYDENIKQFCLAIKDGESLVISESFMNLAIQTSV